MSAFLTRATRYAISRTRLGEAASKIGDFCHHFYYSFSERTPEKDKQRLKFYLFKYHHIIEKGLALPKPNLCFGQPKIINLIEKSESYVKKYGHDKIIDSIKKTIIEYLAFHEKQGATLPEKFERKLLDFSAQANSNCIGGLRPVVKSEMNNLTPQEFNDFVRCRYSVRNFSNEPVDENLIFTAIETATYAPSVCNRQSWHVHYYSEKNTIRNILYHQNGNAGFADTIDKLLIITGDTRAFTENESNQIFVDGGLFSMNLILALHSAGLGSCALNTSYSYLKEHSVKKIARIPNSERLIMMLAVGHTKQNFDVAASPRKPKYDFFTTHNY
ncbi:nitroreductase family protein [Pseudomonas vancouverensis]|uniref:Nitroreductase family protein n=1 Tax=Pseudomonas vancouverensis TaxID=95300 RepID=A0A1H2MPM2_PSEVA|nr:nitroreductase family protein [Pseudomonas vancouverensis]KAB0494583.1 nitroreductase family protein [Pseudomonas vancouverensis]TDB59249.1 nitroreductase family protein [Pseudomonas vancouverensis]SDU95169.1 Nitroreductase [Pseudomonas vancouverensis]